MPRPPTSLLVASAVMLALRIGWVLRFREIDSDAYGHFFIAFAARKDPTNLAVHWVWLPLYHFVVGALTGLGLGLRGLRLINAVLASVGPLLLWDAMRRRDERHALLAATAFAIAPLTTILGQSAQPETMFLVFVVAALHGSARDWPVRAGVWLALAAMVRYEAWGATLALGAWWLARDRSRRMLPFIAIPAGIIALYVLLRWWTDGTLLLFFRGTRDITKVQVAREAWSLYALIDFPLVLPFVVLGPAILLVPLGARRALDARAGTLALGFAAFLLLSYYTGGSHAGERYLVSLMPFACMAIGSAPLPRRVPPNVVLALVAVTTVWHLQRAARMAIAWDDGLREREIELERSR